MRRPIVASAVRGAVRTALSLVVMGCGATLCPQVVKYLEPVITIRTVLSSVDGSPVSQLTISDVRVAGRRPTDDELRLYVAGPSRGIVVEGDHMICAIPCGFGTDPVHWEFLVSAPGYQSKTVSLVAAYANYIIKADECTQEYSGGSKIDLVLDPVVPGTVRADEANIGAHTVSRPAGQPVENCA